MKKKISSNKWDFSSHVAPGVGTWSLNLINAKREEDATTASEKKY